MQAQYPTHSVNVVKADLSDAYVTTSGDEEIGVEVRDTLEDAISDGGFLDNDSFAEAFAIVNGERDDDFVSPHDLDSIDAGAAVVPNDYFNSEGQYGVHYGGNPQPPAAPLIEIRSPIAVAHEFGHHFFGDNIYNGEDYDGSDGHSFDLWTTKFDLRENSFTSETAAPSLMDAGPGPDSDYTVEDFWMDSVAYDNLINDEFSPTPSVGISDDDGDGWFLLARATSDGIDVRSQHQTDLVQSPDDSDVTATARDSSGAVVAENQLSRGVERQYQTGDNQRDANVIYGTVSFPDGAVTIEITAPTPDGDGTVSTTTNPYGERLREALLSVPEASLSIAPQGYVQWVANQLDTADRHVQNGRIRPAVNVLESIDKTVQQHIEAGYDTARSSVYSKEALRELIALRIERLTNPAETPGQSNDNGQATGTGGGNGRGNGTGSDNGNGPA